MTTISKSVNSTSLHEYAKKASIQRYNVNLTLREIKRQLNVTTSIQCQYSVKSTLLKRKYNAQQQTENTNANATFHRI